MEQIENEYFEIGRMPQEVLMAVGVDDWPIKIKESELSAFGNDARGKEMDRLDLDTYCGGCCARFDMMVNNPHQVRDAGRGMLLLVQSFDGYFVEGDYVDKICFAMRITKAVDNNGDCFWEFVDIDLHYNLKRNDPVLWTRE